MLFFEIRAALFHVDVVPGEAVAQVVGVVVDLSGINAAVGEGLPPEVGLEMLAPAIHPRAAPPGEFDRVAQPPVEVPVTSWVVRELQLEEPGAALTMRILDLTTPPADDDAPADYEPMSTWSSFARPA